MISLICLLYLNIMKSQHVLPQLGVGGHSLPAERADQDLGELLVLLYQPLVTVLWGLNWQIGIIIPDSPHWTLI